MWYFSLGCKRDPSEVMDKPCERAMSRLQFAFATSSFISPISGRGPSVDTDN